MRSAQHDRVFITRLLDLREDGWSRQGIATYDPGNAPFFDPEAL
jgi:hypothetical protein